MAEPLTEDELRYLRGRVTPRSSIWLQFRGATCLPAELVHLLLDEIDRLRRLYEQAQNGSRVNAEVSLTHAATIERLEREIARLKQRYEAHRVVSPIGAAWDSWCECTDGMHR